jgi:putative flippase GtrA
MTLAFLAHHKHQLERYVLSGSLAFILGHIQYRCLYTLLQEVPMCAGIAWGLHFIIGTVWSHALHRGFTFRNTPQLPYFISLYRTYGLYVFVLSISTAMMILLCDIGGIHPLIGWTLVTGISAICNFLIMSCWTICRIEKDSK